MRYDRLKMAGWGQKLSARAGKGVCVGGVVDSIVSIVSNIFNSIKVGCARAMTRQAPWYVPCA